MGDSIFKAHARMDARSLAAFRKMRMHDIRSSDQARKIRLPLVFRMEFDGLKCIKMDRIYRLSQFFRQLGGDFKLDDKDVRELFEEKFPNPDYRINDGSALQQQRQAVTDRFSTTHASYMQQLHGHQDYEVLAGLYNETLLPNAWMVDPILGITSQWLQFISDPEQCPDCHHAQLLRTTNGCWATTTSNMVVNGKANVLAATKQLLKWFRVFCTVKDQEFQVKTQVQRDFGTIEIDAIVHINPKPLSASPQGSEFVVSDPDRTNTVNWKEFAVLNFEPGTAVVRNIYMRRVQGELLMEQLGLCRPQGQVIVGTGMTQSSE